MTLRLRDRTIEFLQIEPNKKFTARQIAEWVFETYPKECEAKRVRSTARVFPLDDRNSFITQLVAEIGSNRPSMQKNIRNLKRQRAVLANFIGRRNRMKMKSLTPKLKHHLMGLENR